MTTTTPPITVLPTSPAQVAKALVYIVLTGAALLAAATHGSGVPTLAQLLTVIVTVLGLIPVYLFAGRWVKAGVAFVVAILNALIPLWATGFAPLNYGEWIAVGLSAFAAIGIVVVPNEPLPTLAQYRKIKGF